MNTSDIDAILRALPDNTPSTNLNKALLAGFDDFQRNQRNANSKPSIGTIIISVIRGWFAPTAGGLVSLSIGLMAGLMTAPAAADTHWDYAEDTEISSQWYSDSWLNFNDIDAISERNAGNG